jgi:hemerythrin-like metal-binding protein
MIHRKEIGPDLWQASGLIERGTVTMPIMSWDASLDVGVEPMNHDHKEILAAMNAVYDASAQGQAGEAVNSLVAKLGQVCVRHFTDEERYMGSIGYPGLDRHKQHHAQLLTQFQDHAREIRQAGGRPTDEFFYFLKFWLTSHIRGIDTKYAAHAKSGAAA